MTILPGLGWFVMFSLMACIFEAFADSPLLLGCLRLNDILVNEGLPFEFIRCQRCDICVYQQDLISLHTYLEIPKTKCNLISSTVHVHAVTLPPTSNKFVGRCFDPECSVFTVPCKILVGPRPVKEWDTADDSSFVCVWSLAQPTCQNDVYQSTKYKSFRSGFMKQWNHIDPPPWSFGLQPRLQSASIPGVSSMIQVDPATDQSHRWPHDQACAQGNVVKLVGQVPTNVGGPSIPLSGRKSTEMYCNSMNWCTRLCFGRSQASKHRRRMTVNVKICMTTVIVNLHQISV